MLRLVVKIKVQVVSTPHTLESVEIEAEAISLELYFRVRSVS